MGIHSFIYGYELQRKIQKKKKKMKNKKKTNNSINHLDYIFNQLQWNEKSYELLII